MSPIPAKTCSYTCVYCQLGRTNRLESERHSYFPKEEIVAEVVRQVQETAPDYVTFVGDGEPTLCSDLHWLIDRTRRETAVPIAVITNGSLLWRADVRSDLAGADVVMPTLDAGNERTFRSINRPHRRILFDKMLQGQIDFGREFAGALWLEVMLVKGVNDSDEELVSIKRAVEKIQPDRVYVLTPVRPPAETWVKPSIPEAILRAQEIIGHAIPVSDLETGQFGLEEFPDARQAILEIGSRHPLRCEQAHDIEKAFSELGTVDQMIEDGVLVEVAYNGNRFLLPGYFVRGRQPAEQGGNVNR